jgi:hypothetical protein
MPLRQYFAKTLILQGFQAAKNRVFSSFFAHFPLILKALPPSHITKKTQKPLYFLHFKALTFFSVKTDNALILYRFIYLIYTVSFVMTEELKLTIFTYKCAKTVKKGLPESLINKGF